jgi:hypothetical protein
MEETSSQTVRSSLPDGHFLLRHFPALRTGLLSSPPYRDDEKTEPRFDFFLQPNKIEQELEPEVKHPTPGVANLLGADRL